MPTVTCPQYPQLQHMLQLSQTLVALIKQIVLRGVRVARHNEVKLSRDEARIVEKRPLTSASWLALDPKVWPCQLNDEKPVVSRAPDGSAVTSKSSDFLPCSSPPTLPATPSMFSEDKPSTTAVLTMPPSCIPNVVISDDDAEKAGHRSDIECESKDMFLEKTAKEGQRSESDGNTLVREDPKTLDFLAPPGAFLVLRRKRRVIPRKRRSPSAPWLALEPMVWWPCRLPAGSKYLLFGSMKMQARGWDRQG
ncbi:hypothetical protein JB92DRAFT_2826412 [Gautieria morchelliformis]|nr:hypothetical protein JB92DRAFT_2826412 [Gautieria morchelliformis]